MLLFVRASAFLNGFLLMSYEMALPRIMAPWIGHSPVSWSAVVGVVLGATALGNFFGGRISGKGKNREAILFSSSLLPVFFLFSWFFADAFSAWTGSLGLPLVQSSMLVSLVLAAPHAFLCGVFPPCFLALLGDETKKRSGEVLASDTFGGIVGTFVGGFWAVPLLGASTSLALLVPVSAIFLFASAAAAGVHLRMRSCACFLALAFLPVLFPSFPEILSEKSDNIVAIRDTRYSRIIVAEKRTERGSAERHLLVQRVGNFSLSKSVEDDPFDVHPYMEILQAPVDFFESSGRKTRTLVVGGGGYSLPRRILALHENARTTVVEIDPDIPEIAREFFFAPLDDPRLASVVADGRRFVEETGETFDVIAVDVLTGPEIPFHLCSREFFETAGRKLSRGGILGANFVLRDDAGDDSFQSAFVSTVLSVLPFAKLYETGSGKGGERNGILLASFAPLPEFARSIEEKRTELPPKSAPFTDEKNRSETLLHTK